MIETPDNSTGRSNHAATSTTARVVVSVVAASHNSTSANSGECKKESVITKASGPPDNEAHCHTPCETDSSVSTGLSVGSVSGALSY